MSSQKGLWKASREQLLPGAPLQKSPPHSRARATPESPPALKGSEWDTGPQHPPANPTACWRLQQRRADSPFFCSRSTETDSVFPSGDRQNSAGGFSAREK